MAEALVFNEEQRSYLLEIAETLVFVDAKETVDEYKCIDCDKVAIEHRVTNCKHIFCLNCIMKLFNKPCPSCNVKITEVKNDDQVANGLMELNVECPYKKYGCQEIVPLYRYQGHEKTCQMSTKELLPKLYVEPSQQEKISEGDSDIHKIKTSIKGIRAEMKKKASQKETNKSLSGINTTLETMSEEITQLKNMSHEITQLRTIHQESEKLIQELQHEVKALKKSQHKSYKKFNTYQKKGSDSKDKNRETTNSPTGNIN